MNPKKFKIILVDDHTLLRDALSNLINSFEEFSVINSFSISIEDIF
jgi:DNA-binding NarL/FixJ family response regulator